MSATESWQAREARMKVLEDELERATLRLEAATAQKMGIDIFRPGWRDEYLEGLRQREEENKRVDALIATPHVDEAIDRLEAQFSDEAVAS